MSMGDIGPKGLFDSLPTWARHSISLTTFGGILVANFVLFVREPLAQAAANDDRQDKVAQHQQQQIDTLTSLVTQLTQAQAVQVETNRSIAAGQDNLDRRMGRIEDKLDRNWRGR